MIVELKTLMYIEVLLVIGLLAFYVCLRPVARRVIKPVYVLIVLAIPLFGLFGGTKTVFYALIFCIPLVSAGDGHRLAGIYSLALPLFPELREPFLIGSFYLVQLSAITVFNLGALVALLFVQRRSRPPVTLDLIAWLLFFLMLALSTRGSSVTETIRAVADVFLMVMPPYLIMSRSIRNQSGATIATLLFLLGALLNAVVAIFDALHHWPLFHTMYDALGVAPQGTTASLLVRAGFMRAQGAIDNMGSLALLISLGLLGWLTVGRHLSRSGRWVVFGILLLGLLSSQLRGGWVAAAIGIGLYFLYRGRGGTVLGLGAAALVASTALLALPSDSRLAEALGLSGGGQDTYNYRSQLLRRGLEEIGKHPLQGQTAGQLSVSMADMRQGEHIIDFVNTPLWVALSLGLGGLLLYLLVWIVPMTIAWRRRRQPSFEGSRPWLAMAFAGTGTVFVFLLTTSPIDRNLPFAGIVLGLLAATSALRRADRRARWPSASWTLPQTLGDQPRSGGDLVEDAQPARG